MALGFMTQLILEGILKNAEREHLLHLREYLRSMRLLYEEGKITEKDYRRIEETVTQTIKELQARLKSERDHNTLELRF